MIHLLTGREIVNVYSIKKIFKSVRPIILVSKGAHQVALGGHMHQSEQVGMISVL